MKAQYFEGNMDISENTEKMLRLLSQVIIADGHIHDSELNALTDCVNSIGLKDKYDILLGRETVKNWFSDHADELSAFQASDNSDVQLTRLIVSLSDWPEKQPVVDALEKISLADGKMHMEEKLLISIVRAYWQFDGLETSDTTIDSR